MEILKGSWLSAGLLCLMELYLDWQGELIILLNVDEFRLNFWLLSYASFRLSGSLAPTIACLSPGVERRLIWGIVFDLECWRVRSLAVASAMAGSFSAPDW